MQTKGRRRSSVVSLGRVIVALYVATLLTAVISARTLAENNTGQTGTPQIDPQETTFPVTEP